MTAWGVTICFAMALGLVACRDDGADDATPSTDEVSSSASAETSSDSLTAPTFNNRSAVIATVECTSTTCWAGVNPDSDADST